MSTSYDLKSLGNIVTNNNDKDRSVENLALMLKSYTVHRTQGVYFLLLYDTCMIHITRLDDYAMVPVEHLLIPAC